MARWRIPIVTRRPWAITLAAIVLIAGLGARWAIELIADHAPTPQGRLTHEIRYGRYNRYTLYVSETDGRIHELAFPMIVVAAVFGLLMQWPIEIDRD